MNAAVRAVVRSAEFHKIDCCDLGEVKKIMKGINVVFHCAATAHEGLSVFSPHFVTKNIYDVFDFTDCVVVMTEWDTFSRIDWNLASKKMRKPGWVFDTRNIVDKSKVEEAGLNLWVLGKNL